MAGVPPNLDYLPYQRQGWHGGWNYQQSSYPRGNKRQKGNPVVQRYAPPPGYVPPPNSAPPYAGQYPGYHAQASSPQGYNYSQQYQAPYPYPQAYGQTPLYHPGSVPQHPQHPQHPQPSPYPIPQSYHQPFDQQPHSAPATNSPFPINQPNVSAPEQKAQIDPQKQPLSKKDGRPPTDDYSYDIPCTWDEGGDGSGYGNDNALWPKSDDDVDKRFSIGLICFYPPKETTRALMPTWELAEEQEKDNGRHRPALGNRDSVSEYYRHDNDYQAYLDVRQTDEWEEYQHDPIFKNLTSEGNWIPLREAIALRGRAESPSSSTTDGSQDRLWDEVEQWQRSFNVEESTSQSSHPPQDSMSDKHHDHFDDHYGYSSGHQEKVLAQLGVEGPAKPHPTMAHEDEDEDRMSLENYTNNTYSRRSTPVESPSAGHLHMKAGQKSQTSDEQAFNQRLLSRRDSNSSQHTVAGSDFVNRTPSESNGTRPSSFKATPPPPSPPQERGRKRNYHDYDDEMASEDKEIARQKKIAASHSKNPYSRRW